MSEEASVLAHARELMRAFLAYASDNYGLPQPSSMEFSFRGAAGCVNGEKPVSFYYSLYAPTVSLFAYGATLSETYAEAIRLLDAKMDKKRQASAEFLATIGGLMPVDQTGASA